MKKQLLLFVILFLGGCISFNEKTMYVVTHPYPINVYEYKGPRSDYYANDSKIYGQLMPGDTVPRGIYDADDGWVSIEYKNKTAWVDDDYVKQARSKKDVAIYETFKRIDVSDQYNLQWLYIPILILSIILWILREFIRYREGPLTEYNLFIINYVALFFLSILELIYRIIGGCSMIFLNVLDSEWLEGIIGFIILTFILYNQILCVNETMEDFKYYAKGNFRIKLGLFSVIGIIALFMISSMFEGQSISELITIFAICQLIQIYQIYKGLHSNGSWKQILMCSLVYLVSILAILIMVWEFVVIILVIIIFSTLFGAFIGSGSNRNSDSNKEMWDGNGNRVYGEHIDSNTFRANNGEVYRRNSCSNTYYNTNGNVKDFLNIE